MGQADNTSLCTNHQKKVCTKIIAVFFHYCFFFPHSVDPKYKCIWKTKHKKSLFLANSHGTWQLRNISNQFILNNWCLTIKHPKLNGINFPKIQLLINSWAFATFPRWKGLEANSTSICRGLLILKSVISIMGFKEEKKWWILPSSNMHYSV